MRYYNTAMSNLRQRQQRFVDEYMVDLNATRAAIAAGYSKNTASQAGWEVLRNPKVAAEISRRQQALAERNEITAGRVIEELAKLAFSNLGDFYKVNEEGSLELDLEALADPKRAAAVAQIDITEKANGSRVTKIRLADKRAALVDLGRHLGLFESEAPQAVPVDAPSDNEVDTRHLALAVIALLREASVDGVQPVAQTLLPMRRRAASEDAFELDI